MGQIQPTPEEIEQVKGSGVEPEMLGNTEQFILALSAIPRLNVRLELFLFKQNFPGIVQSADGEYCALSSYCMRTSLPIYREPQAGGECHQSSARKPEPQERIQGTHVVFLWHTS